MIEYSLLDFIKLAYQWHSGQNSALYKFACEYGKIWDKQHAIDLENEINECINIHNKNDEEFDKLDSFIKHVEKIYEQYN